MIELFTCKDQARCKEIAEKLNQLNLERQSEEQRIVAEIEEQLAAEPDLTGKFCMVFDGDGWHRGVVGIVASRVVEKTGRPGSGDCQRRGRSSRIRPIHFCFPSAECA